MRRLLLNLDHATVVHCSFDTFAGRLRSDLVSDLCQVALRDGIADVVLCSHVLEHIADLDSCLSEMQRVLKPGGSAWIQVPYEPGRASTRCLHGEALRPHGHAWLFGRDFGRLLSRPGWDVVEHRAWANLPEPALSHLAINPLETYWVACRHPTVAARVAEAGAAPLVENTRVADTP
jgi:SAM-dependent methyltransferase